MAAYKRKYDSGTALWYFKFQPPGAARGSLPIRQFGFATKREAEDAEANRRTEEQKKYELAKAGSGVAAAPDGVKCWRSAGPISTAVTC